jgi:hypothetical protein
MLANLVSKSEQAAWLKIPAANNSPNPPKVDRLVMIATGELVYSMPESVIENPPDTPVKRLMTRKPNPKKAAK